jgi:hypothetical protein
VKALVAVKEKLAPALMRIAGVLAVGVRSQGLTVYLADDSNEVRHNVAKVVASESREGDVPLHFEISARFRAANR